MRSVWRRIMCFVKDTLYFESRNRWRQNKETPIETNRRTREIAMRLNLSNSGVHDCVKRLGVSSSWKNKITFWTISKFGYIYWKWLDSKKWLDTDVCSQGIKRVLPLPLQIQWRGRMCFGLCSRLRLRDNRKKRKRQGGNKRGNRFQRECTRHVLRYMEPCDCFPNSGSTRARIHGQTSLDERKGVSIGKDPSLLFTTQRGSPSLVEFSFLDKSIYIFWLEKLNWIILIIKIIFVYEKKSNSTMRAFCEKKVRDKVRLFILIITWTLWKKYRFKRS